MFRALFKQFITRQMFMFATPGITPDLGGGGAASGSGSSGPVSSGGSSGGAPPSTGALGGSPTPSGGNGNIASQSTPGQGNGSIDWGTAPAHFRTAYEELRAKLEPWTKLGVGHEVAQTYVQTTQGMVTEGYKLGRELGYSDSEIQEALRTDIVRTMSFLRGKSAENGQGGQGQGQDRRQGQGQGRPGQLDPATQRLLDQRLSPLESHLNSQIVDAANQAFSTEFERLFADHYKADAQAIPKEVREFLKDAVSEVFKYNDDGLRALKYDRDVKAVAGTFQLVLNRFEQAMNSYHMWQMGKSSGRPSSGPQGARPQQGQPPQQDQGWGGLTLDDIAQGDDRAVKLIPSMR